MRSVGDCDDNNDNRNLSHSAYHRRSIKLVLAHAPICAGAVAVEVKGRDREARRYARIAVYLAATNGDGLREDRLAIPEPTSIADYREVVEELTPAPG